MQPTTQPDRHFLVKRCANVVIIREVPPGSCAFYRNRAEAWEHANRQARAHKASQDPRGRVAVGISFMALDGTVRPVKTAQAVQAEQQGRRAATGQPAPAPRQRMSDEERRAKRNEYRRNRRAARKAALAA